MAVCTSTGVVCSPDAALSMLVNPRWVALSTAVARCACAGRDCETCKPVREALFALEGEIAAAIDVSADGDVGPEE